MNIRQIVEPELLQEHIFGAYARELYQSGRWNKLFEARTVEDFQHMLDTEEMPEDEIAQEIFKNNVSSQAPESQLFSNGFDLCVLGATRYNLGCIHMHNFFEMYYLAKGTCRQQINGQDVPMQPGDFLILAPNSAHHMQVLDNTTILLIIALRKSTFQQTFFGLFHDADILSNFFMKALNNQSSSPYLIFRTGGDGIVLDHLYRMYYECNHPIPYSRQALNNKMSDLFIYLLRYHQENLISVRSAAYGSARLLPILQYIQIHYATVTLSELAERFHYQQPHISRLLKRETGKTFNELKQSLRLSRAAELLRQTDLPIQQIAADLDYSDQSHFARHFRSVYGVTPKAYREHTQADVEPPATPFPLCDLH